MIEAISPRAYAIRTTDSKGARANSNRFTTVHKNHAQSIVRYPVVMRPFEHANFAESITCSVCEGKHFIPAAVVNQTVRVRSMAKGT